MNLIKYFGIDMTVVVTLYWDCFVNVNNHNKALGIDQIRIINEQKLFMSLFGFDSVKFSSKTNSW
jgi:hypothetical protein